MNSKQPSSQMDKSPPITANNPSPSKQGKKPTAFMSSHNNRLGGLMFHPEIIPEHKEMLQAKMNKVIFMRKFVEYGGGTLLFLHMAVNRLKFSKTTGLFIAVPPVLSYLIKLMGYVYVDNYAETSGMYKIYKISTL